jgi:hypothetical protein
MSKSTLEERLSRLERLTLQDRDDVKNEFKFFGLEKPKVKDQAEFVKKLFKKDPDLSKYLNVSSPSSKPDNVFHLFLYVKDKEYGNLNNLRFIISTPSNKNNMYCSVVDDDHKSKPIAVLNPVNIDKDLDKIAKFIRDQINAALKRRNKSESNRCDEFLEVFNKPKETDEAAWLKQLFSKYPSIKRRLEPNDNVNKSSKKPFHIILTNRDNASSNNIHFIIASTTGKRSDMYCSALNDNNVKIGCLKPFHFDDINKCAKFILQTLNGKLESKRRKFENVPLTTFDCKNIQSLVEKAFTEYDLPELEVDIADDNADYGFLNVSVYNPDYVTDYDLIVNESNSIELENNDKKVGTAKSFRDAADMLARHFNKNYAK